jgi:hypothetical protein
MDNATRKELLYRARAVGYPGSILDVFANYNQGKDLIGEYEQQMQMQQMQQQQMPAQQPQQQMQQAPQIPAIPSSPTPAPNFTPPQPPAPIGVQSQDAQMGIVSNQSGPNQGRAIFATGGFTNGPSNNTNGPVAKAVEKTLSKNEDIDPETMFYGKYNTPLTEREQKRFDKWATKESERQGRDIMMDKGAYDIQGFWRAGDWKRMDADNHGTDTWKKPNHPTFSTLSRYHGADGMYGGNWTKEAGYQPSKQTANRYSQEYYSWLFGNEPNRLEHIDMSRYDGKNLGTPVVYAKGGFTNGGPGKPNTATAADSSFVANSANEVHNFYTKNGYKTLSPSEIKAMWGGEEVPNMKTIFEDFKTIRDAYSPGQNIHTNATVPYNEYTNYKAGSHKFEQRELSAGLLNIKAPRSKYDDRILPQKYAVYEGDGDLAEVVNYDKLAVTPWKELSDNQKIKRLQQFGGSGTPYKDAASIKQAIINLKNPVPVRLDMKEATKFPISQVNIKPQYTSLPIPQTTKQRVVVNTPEGDKIRVQDIKTKKFLGWEDAKGLPSDVENPSGNASQDFPEMRRIKTPAFAYGGFKEKKCYTCVGRKRRV